FGESVPKRQCFRTFHSVKHRLFRAQSPSNHPGRPIPFLAGRTLPRGFALGAGRGQFHPEVAMFLLGRTPTPRAVKRGIAFGLAFAVLALSTAIGLTPGLANAAGVPAKKSQTILHDETRGDIVAPSINITLPGMGGSLKGTLVTSSNPNAP